MNDRQVGSVLRRCCAALLVLLLLLSCAGSAFAADITDGIAMETGSAAEYTEITARYYENVSGVMQDMPIEYTDEFFQRDPDVFYMDLARASFGLTESAFRTGTDEGVSLDANVESFLTQAGFENFESTWYDQDPTEDSIASAVAEKKIGDTTVIAFVCAGAGYGTEWLSNLTLGSGTEHEGFSSAADQCEERLTEYMERYGITGNVELWVSGLSRAAAVGNLLAAHMMETGRFGAIYGYFFATPNNTQEPVAYPNLFNIIGQNDPVPQIPLSSWGYGRNGVDVHTPAQEANSSYITEALLADETYSATTGQSFRNNPDLNRQLHVVFEYLSVIFPTAEDYTTILQPRLLKAYRQHSSSDLLSILREVVADINGLSLERQNAADALVDYLDEVIYQYVSGNDIQNADGSWNASDALSVNIALEHQPSTYVAWLFSEDDPSALFAGSTETMRLVIEGDFYLEVWDEDGIVQSISSDNEEAVYAPGEDRPDTAPLVYLYASNHDGKAVINLPNDRDYTLKLTMENDGAVSLFSDCYSYGEWTNDVSDVVLFVAREGDSVVLTDFFSPEGTQVCTADGAEVHCLRQTLSSDIQSIIAREQMMSGNFSVRGLLIVAILVFLLLLVFLIAALVFFLIGRKRAKRRTNAAVTVCFSFVTVIFAAAAVAFSLLLPNIRLIPASLAVLAFVFTGINALRCRSVKAAVIALGMAVLGFADYYVFFRRSWSAVNGLVLALLVPGGLILTVLAARKVGKREKNGTPGRTVP